MAKVLIAFSNMLFSEGVSALLKDEDDIDEVEVVKAGANPYRTVEAFQPDVVLVDYTTLHGSFADHSATDNLKLILLDTGCGESNIISAVITKGLKGVLICNSNAALLKKAIKAVAEGEVWLDKMNVKNLLTGLRNMKKSTRPTLSDREKEIVRLVGMGHKNKEIAAKLCISEPTVKTHLHRIFQKLDIQNRPQLITFAIKNQGAVSHFTESLSQ